MSRLCFGQFYHYRTSTICGSSDKVQQTSLAIVANIFAVEYIDWLNVSCCRFDRIKEKSGLSTIIARNDWEFHVSLSAR